MNSDRAHLAELFLGFVDLTNEINESISRLGNTLLWPIGELELTDCAGLPILSKTMPQWFNKIYVIKEQSISNCFTQDLKIKFCYVSHFY